MAINGNFQFRRGTAAQWSSANTILLSGELGLETDTDLFKIGDGTTAWNMLPYGGLQGVAGQASQTIVGATVVINPNQNPSVTDADAGPNADLRFSLPRAREVNVVATNTVAPATSASVTQTADAEGDVNLTFNIPRGAKGWSPVLAVVADGARRVLRLIDYVDGEGTKPTIPTDNYIGTTGLTTLANAVDIRGEVGATGPAANSFTNIAVTGQNTVVADQASDTLTLVAGANITITTNDATDSITISSTSVATNAFGIVTGNTGTATADLPTDTLAITGGTGISTAATDTPDGLVITNTDTGSAARTAHEAAADPHPQYTTTAEAAAAAPVQSVSAGTGISVNATTGAITVTNAGVTSVNGQTGAVSVASARPRIGPPTLANATTTTETVVAKVIIPANFLTAGDAIRMVVNHQSAGTGTLIYRARIGALGTIADGLLATLTTSAAQVANAQGRADFTIYFPNTTTATGSGFAIQQAAVLGTVTGAGANVTISNTATVHLSITVQCSAAAANVTRGAWATVGD